MQVGIHAHERQDGEKQRERLDALAQHAIERTGSDEEPDHRVARCVTGEIQPRPTDDFDDVVGTVAMPAGRHLSSCQPTFAGNEIAEPGEGQHAAHHFRIINSDATSDTRLAVAGAPTPLLTAAKTSRRQRRLWEDEWPVGEHLRDGRGGLRGAGQPGKQFAV